MRFIKLFEKFKGRKRVYRDHDKGKEGISEISGRIDPKFVEVKDPIDTLKVIIEKICKEMGLVDKVRYLNAGSYGMAFKVGSKVIKLTSNRSEAKMAKDLIGKKIPNVINYYKIKWVRKYEIWAILMDLVDTPTKGDKKILDIFDYCEDWSEVVDEIEDRNISKSEAKSLWREYQKLKKSLEKSGIPMDDLHSGNIGRLGGELVHFDIMPETGKDEISKLSGS